MTDEKRLQVVVCGGRDFMPRNDDDARFTRWLEYVAPALLKPMGGFFGDDFEAIDHDDLVAWLRAGAPGDTP